MDNCSISTILSSIPSSAYSAILSASAVLLGVWLTNILNIKRIEKEAVIQDNRAAKLKTQTSIDELFILFTQWSNLVTTYQRNRAAVMDGQLSHKAALELFIKHSSETDHTFARIELIVRLHTQELIPLHDKISMLLRQTAKMTLAHDNDCLKGNEVNKKLLTPFLELHKQFIAETESFKSAIIELARKENLGSLNK